MRTRNLAFLVAAILVLAPALAFAQQAAAGNQAAGTQSQATPNADQGAGAQATDTQAAQAKPGKAMKEKMKAGMHTAATCPCPYCPMKEDKGAKDAHGQQMHMMMNARITRDDPGVILGMREDLNLTAEQTQKLEQLQAENKQKVEAILTAEQKTQIAKLPSEALSMRDMHQQMASKMSNQPGGENEPGAIDKPDQETAARKELMNKEIMNK